MKVIKYILGRTHAGNSHLDISVQFYQALLSHITVSLALAIDSAIALGALSTTQMTLQKIGKLLG